MRAAVLIALAVAAGAALPAEAQFRGRVRDVLETRLAQSPAALEGRLLNEALFEAAALDCRAIAKAMLARGASVDARNRRGAAPLTIAAEMGSRDVAELLLERGADLHQRDLDGITPLKTAAFEGDPRFVDLLLEAGAETGSRDSDGKGALVYAAGRAYPGIVARLLEAGADADTVWGHDLTALMWAAGHANDAPAADGIEVARTLLRAGARIDRRDDRGRTALMIAAERGHARMVAFLLEQGADPGVRDNAGLTPADLAANGETRGMLR